MKKEYVKPEVEEIELSIEDVITDIPGNEWSSGDNTWGDD